MLAHYTYAAISNGVVQNVMVCSDLALANQIVMATYGAEAFAIEVSYVPCTIGDKYADGNFYHEETLVEAVPNEKEEIATLKSMNQSITLVLADLIGG